MSSGAQQLKEDFKQVQKLLEIYPNIKITNTEGDPPEQYDIEYFIKGYKTSPEGAPTPDNNHKVRITLPFGYPHFPPTVKPITPIFHPDIDPDAIRIADFWQENHSLPDLIVHIGQMICGNHYTKDEPFNQNAFEWFEERSSWLPFDVLEPGDEDDTEQIETTGTPADTKTQQSFAPAKDLDILKDDFDFSFDDDDEYEKPSDEISFDFDESTVSGDLIELEDNETADEITFDIEEDKSTAAVDLPASKDEETEDFFNFDTDDNEDDFSFDLTGEVEKTEPVDNDSLTEDLFALESETVDEESDEETPYEFDSKDISSAFKEETALDDTTLNEPAGIKEKDDFDFGIAEDSLDTDEGGTADLSGLVEEITEAITPEPEDTPNDYSGDEDKILSALSLDEDLTSTDQTGEKSQAIRALIEQKQIFSAKKVLTELSPQDLPAERKEFELTIADAVSEAEDLYKKADRLEQKGEFEKAGILLDLVANITVDFPGLDFARNRIRESMMSFGKKRPDVDPDNNGEQAADGESDFSAIPSDKKKKSRTKVRFKIPTRLIIILLAILVLVGIGAGTVYLYMHDAKVIQLAQASFQGAEQFVDRKEFKDAQEELDAAMKSLDKVLLFQRTEKEAIISKITNLTDSNLFKEGLNGRVLYGDQYVSIETAKAIDKFNTQKNYAEQILKAGKLEQAITAYEKSLPYAEKAGYNNQLESINRKIAELRLQLLINQAKQFEKEQNWFNAQKTYQDALQLSQSISTAEVQNDITNWLATASYRYNLQEGLKAINDSQWQKAIDAFQSVQKILKENPQVIPETTKTEIDKLLVESHLFFGLTQAKKAYENKEWKEAIDKYNDAIVLMETNSALLGQEATGNIQKINKTILTTHVAREQARVAYTKAANELDETVTHYEAIITLIEKSTFKDDEMLHKILADAQTKSAEIKNQLVINKKEKWLMDNYEKIFRDNYPSAKQSELLNPQVRFIKREGNNTIFTISCSEQKQGRTFRLELNYQHNMEKDAWSLYSGTIEKE